jgi:hypothetical protein
VLVEVDIGGVINAEAHAGKGPFLFTIAGRVSHTVSRMVWQAPNGKQVPVSIRDGYFVARAVNPGGFIAGPDHLLAYDATGHSIATTQSLSLYLPSTKPVATCCTWSRTRSTSVQGIRSSLRI